MKNSILIVLCCFSLILGATQKELIEIPTNNTSIILGISPEKKVSFLHWGEKIKDIQPFMNKSFIKQPDTNDDMAPQLYPAYGDRYYLEPALKLTHSDGVLTTSLIYDLYEETKIDDNRTKYMIRLKDKIYPVFVEVEFTCYKKEDVISQSVTIYHKGDKTLKVENLASAYIPIHAESYYLTHFHGTWAAEMQMEEEKLGYGIKVIETKKGVRATQAENPSFLISTNTPSDEDSGEIYAGTLAWSGNYKLAFEIGETGELFITSGMNPFASTYNLKAEERLTSPEMILTYSPEGKGKISRNYHNWARAYGMAHGDKIHPILLNSWEGAYFNFDENTITTMIDNAADFGIEMFVLDDGWFGNKYPRNSDNAGLGDWQVNKKKLPRGINYLADYAVNMGLQFGIWIEPEMVNPDSELAKKHPEWIVKSGERHILPMRNQWLLDLSNPEVQDFVFKTFDNIVSLSNNISYVKWDANRHVDNAGSEYLTKDNQTHFWYEYAQGLYKVYERIRNKYPDIQIQLCSSGGGRLEFGALKYHDEFWTSDNTNALDRIFIQYGTNLFFPAIATASHVSTSPNHQTGMLLPLKFRFDVAMSGRLGMEMQPSDIKGDDYEFAKNAIVTYKQIRPVVQFGDLYRLVSPYSESGWASHMYVSKDKKEAVMFAYSLKYHGRTTYFETKLKGLDPDKQYRIIEINRKDNRYSFPYDGSAFSGEFLMKSGVRLDIGGAYDSAVLKIREL